MSRPKDLLPDKLPDLTLSYGQVMWLLLRLGYGSGVTRALFTSTSRPRENSGYRLDKQLAVLSEGKERNSCIAMS